LFKYQILELSFFRSLLVPQSHVLIFFRSVFSSQSFVIVRETAILVDNTFLLVAIHRQASELFSPNLITGLITLLSKGSTFIKKSLQDIRIFTAEEWEQNSIHLLVSIAFLHVLIV